MPLQAGLARCRTPAGFNEAEAEGFDMGSDFEMGRLALLLGIGYALYSQTRLFDLVFGLWARGWWGRRLGGCLLCLGRVPPTRFPAGWN